MKILVTCGNDSILDLLDYLKLNLNYCYWFLLHFSSVATGKFKFHMCLMLYFITFLLARVL